MRLDPTERESIILVSVDNENFYMDKCLCEYSGFLKNIIQNDSTIEKIDMRCSSEVLEVILDFLEYYSGAEYHRVQKPLPADFYDIFFIHQYKEGIFQNDFYTHLMDIFDDEIYQNNFIYIIHYFNYLAIPPLLELACAKMAHMIRYKEQTEIQKILNINEHDYNEMKNANDWSRN